MVVRSDFRANSISRRRRRDRSFSRPGVLLLGSAVGQSFVDAAASLGRRRPLARRQLASPAPPGKYRSQATRSSGPGRQPPAKGRCRARWRIGCGRGGSRRRRGRWRASSGGRPRSSRWAVSTRRFARSTARFSSMQAGSRSATRRTIGPVGVAAGPGSGPRSCGAIPAPNTPCGRGGSSPGRGEARSPDRPGRWPPSLRNFCSAAANSGRRRST